MAKKKIGRQKHATLDLPASIAWDKAMKDYGNEFKHRLGEFVLGFIEDKEAAEDD